MKLCVALLLLCASLIQQSDCRKIHLDIKDLAELKIGDLMELVLPTVNAVKDAITLDNAKSALKAAGNFIGEGAKSAVNAYNEAGGVTGIAKSVAGKATDAFEAVKDLVKPDSPLLKDPNFVAKKLGESNPVSAVDAKTLKEAVENK